VLHRYADERLPTTGVPLEDERALSAIKCYLADIQYGTRSTTVIFMDDNDRVTFVEKALDPVWAAVA
jgi:uncharacterized protein with NRDE domain